MRSLQLCASVSPVSRPVAVAGRLVVATAAVLAVLLPVAAAEDGDDDLVWAVKAPLAPHSLLVDLAAAGSRLVAVGERGHILLSDDGGASWAQAAVPTRSNLTGVFFLDGDRGWAVGHDAVVLRTTDGGETWERVYWAPEDESPLFDVWFAGPDDGFALGAYGMLLVTADGGDTWDYGSLEDVDAHLHRLAQGPDGALFIAAEAGVLFRSLDDGETWEELPSPYGGSFFGVLPLEEDVLLAYGLRGHLYRSEDGGESWTEIDSGTTSLLSDGVLLEDGTVIIVGLGGVVMVSRDGGRTFASLEPEDRRGIGAVLEGPSGTVVMAGEFGVRTVAVTDLGAAGATTEGGDGR